MNSSEDGIQSFLISTFEQREQLFRGYFFHGSDYVHGEQGAKEFAESTGHEIGPGLDGCYVHVTQVADRYIVNTDFSGYKVIYYYHDGDYWAVSDSFARIVRHLRSQNIRILPNYSHLASICSTNSTNNQVFSWNTPMRGVKILPRNHALHILKDQAHLEPLNTSHSRRYPRALAEHLNLWVSRFETLLADDDLQLSIDLTGGVDSRTNFALGLAALTRRPNLVNTPRITCQGDVETSPDARIAKELCADYNLTLNEGNRVAPHRLTPQQGFNVWEDYSLGVYYPLVIPTTAGQSTRVHMNGGGGEVHRDFYVPSSVEGFFNGHAARSKYSWLGTEAAQDGYIAAEYVSQLRREPLMRTHYREFRHRYHVGRLPRQSVSFTPLDSVTAELVHSTSENHASDGQFNYDILANLRYDLLVAPFDKPSKNPTQAHLDNLVITNTDLDSQPGNVWMDSSPQSAHASRSYSSRQRIVPFVSAVEQASKNSFVKDFWGTDMINAASDLVNRLKTGESIGNPVNGFPVSAVLTAELVSPTG